jgi:hypothetical protein
VTVRVGVIGNHRHHHCSEAQWARAFAKNGCAVTALQVDDVAADPEQAMSVLRQQDLVTYTRTHSPTMFLDGSWSDRWRELERHGVQTIGLHLDRFWGLERERLVAEDAQFRVGTLWSADGGSDDKWRAAGVNHEWLVPAADEDDAQTVGTYSPRLAHDVVFVGSGQYHPSYPQRDQLIAHLHDVYGRRFAHYGHGGDHPVVRGDALRNVYASAKVVVGDSCFANNPPDKRVSDYWSDRVPISLSLGAFFVHAWVPGLAAHLDTGRHYVSHVPGDFDDMDAQIGAYLQAPGERAAIAAEGRRHVLRTATWSLRMREILCSVGLGDCDGNEAAA